MTERDQDSTDDLLQELLWTYGPCGQEEAVRTVCARELQPWVDDMWTDDAGNLIGYIGVADAEAREHRREAIAVYRRLGMPEADEMDGTARWPPG